MTMQKMRKERERLRTRLKEIDQGLTTPSRSKHHPASPEARAEARARHLEDLNVAAERSKLRAELAEVQETLQAAARKELAERHTPRCAELAEELAEVDRTLEARVRDLHEALEARQRLIETLGPYSERLAREKSSVGLPRNAEPNAPSGRFTVGSMLELRRWCSLVVADMRRRDTPKPRPKPVALPLKRSTQVANHVRGIFHNASGPGGR